MARIDFNKPSRAKAVYFNDERPPVYDCLIFITDNFLILAEDENETRPNWHNINTIDRIEGVKADFKPPARLG